MIKILALFLVLCISSSAIAQQPNSTVKKKVYAMMKHSAEQDWNAITAQTYPKVFDLISKESFKKTLEQSFNNENFVMKILPSRKRDFMFSNIKLQDRPESDYFFVKHPLKCEMRFKEPMSSEELESIKNAMQSAGFELIKSSRKKLKLLKTNSVMIGLRDKHTQEEWRFLNHDAQIEQFVGKKIVEAAKDFTLKN